MIAQVVRRQVTMERVARFRVLLGLLLTLLVASGARAACKNSFVLYGPSPGQRIELSEDANRNGRTDLSCASGSYVRQVAIYGAHWGTYPDISNVTLICRSPSNSRSVVDFGYPIITTNPNGSDFESSTCPGEHGALTGLRASYGAYLRDFKPRCGGISVAKASVDDRGLHGTWLLDHETDAKTGIQCGTDEVVTGLRLGYRDDGDEDALTSVQLICSGVKAPDRNPPTLAGKTRRSILSGRVVVRASCSSPCELDAAGYVTLPSGEKVFLGEATSDGCIEGGAWTRLVLGIPSAALPVLRLAASRGDLTASIAVKAYYLADEWRATYRDVTLFAPPASG